jgi:hypothetical protein
MRQRQLDQARSSGFAPAGISIHKLEAVALWNIASNLNPIHKHKAGFVYKN